MSAPEPASPDTNLVNLILALLTPMFLWATEGDIRLARVAAAQTLNEYRIANRLSLFTVAKIIAFDIATLSSLSLSMYEDVSMLLALRLRGNATSLDRSGERNRRALEQASRSGETGDSVEAAVAEAQRMVQEAKARVQAAARAAETPQPDADPAPVPPSGAAAARTSAEQRQSAWADAMTTVAGEFTAGLQDLPPGERWKEMARIEALTIAATELASGTAPPPVPAMAAAQPGARSRRELIAEL
nr:hypothetical protein [uncultured Rhodopila sp.]